MACLQNEESESFVFARGHHNSPRRSSPRRGYQIYIVSSSQSQTVRMIEITRHCSDTVLIRAMQSAVGSVFTYDFIVVDADYVSFYL